MHAAVRGNPRILAHTVRGQGQYSNSAPDIYQLKLVLGCNNQRSGAGCTRWMGGNASCLACC